MSLYSKEKDNINTNTNTGVLPELNKDDLGNILF